MSLSIAAVIRFSVVNFQSMKAFRAGRTAGAPDDLRRVIFDSKRLEERWRLFASLTLPSMDAIKSAHFEFLAVVLVSPELPILWRLKLHELAASRPWLVIRDVYFDEGMGPVSEKAFLEAGIGDRLFAFRLDDDDALSSAAVDVVRRLSSGAEDGSILSFDRGFYMRRLSIGRFVLREKYHKNIALGLGVFSSGGSRLAPSISGITTISKAAGS